MKNIVNTTNTYQLFQYKTVAMTKICNMNERKAKKKYFISSSTYLNYFYDFQTNF